MCISVFTSHPDFVNLGFKIRGLFYFALLFVISGIFVSSQFRKILTKKGNIFFLAILLMGLINGYLNNNKFYWIKDDLFSILLIFVGILVSLFIYEKQMEKYRDVLQIILFFYIVSICLIFVQSTFFSFGTGIRYLSYVTLNLSFMFLPLLFMQIVKNKINGQSNIKYFMLLSVIFCYESFFAFMRFNILAILSGITLYMFIYPAKTTITVDIIKKSILFSIILFGTFILVSYLRSGYLDRSASDNYRILEALYVYENYIADNLIFGGGFGKTFLEFNAASVGDLTGPQVTSSHLGFFTILLKLGLIGLISILLLMFWPLIQYFIFSNTLRIYNTKKIILLVPSLFIWFISLIVVRGTVPTQMFGLGLAIGVYFQFTSNHGIENSKIINRINYSLNSMG